MDYDDVIKELGSFGKYQKIRFMLVAIPSIFTAFGAPATSFILSDHPHRCKIPSFHNDTFAVQSEDHLTLLNETIPINEDGSYSKCTIIVNGTTRKCSEWVYDYSTFGTTVTSEFNLVCDRLMVRSHLKSVIVIGYLVGSFGTQLGDIFGRRPILLLVSVVRAAVYWCIPFVNSIPLFGILRFFEGLTSLLFYQMGFVTVIELVGPKMRLFTGNVICLTYSVGLFIVVGIVYFEPNWRWIQIYFAIPVTYHLLLCWPGLFPDSPRWLISRGRMDEARKVLQKMASVNSRKTNIDTTKIKVDVDRGIVVILKDLFHSKPLLLRWLIVGANWFVAGAIYYGLTLNIGKLGGDIYVNFTLLAVVETVGYAVIFLVNLTGRKPLLLVLIFGMAAAAIASILLILFANQSLHWLYILFAMIGRFGVSALFQVLYIYTGELFPTVVRSVVLGTVSILARVGAFISPYLYALADGQFGKILPLLVYTVITVAVGVCSIRLPETNNRKLTETVEEVKLNAVAEDNEERNYDANKESLLNAKFDFSTEEQN